MPPIRCRGHGSSPGHRLPMMWGAREPPSKRPRWGKTHVAASSDLARKSAGPREGTVGGPHRAGHSPAWWMARDGGHPLAHGDKTSQRSWTGQASGPAYQGARIWPFLAHHFLCSAGGHQGHGAPKQGPDGTEPFPRLCIPQAAGLDQTALSETWGGPRAEQSPSNRSAPAIRRWPGGMPSP